MLLMQINLIYLSTSYFILWSILIADISSTILKPSNFLILGPGLNGSITLPVRYFFVYLVDINFHNVTDFNPHQNDLLIDVKFQMYSTGQTIIINQNVFYLDDGSFVIRYRLQKSIVHDSLVITLMWLPTSEYIGNQSFIVKHPIYSEKCHCPQVSLNNWLSKYLQCPTSYFQIEKDFKNIQTIDIENNFKRFYEQFHPFTSVAVCRYKIISNKIHRKCFGEHVGFKMFSDAVLLSLSHKVKLPDIDLLFNLGDWPLANKLHKNFVIISWCGNDDFNDIVIPSYETMEWVLEMMGRVYLDIFTTLKDSYIKWEDKIEKAFWRGRDSSRSRLNLVRLSLNNSDILDAKLTNMFFFPNDSTVGQLVRPISFTDFFAFKYLINMDGTVSAYRFPLSLAGGSLIFKEESKYYEYIYSQLIPNQHYISFKSNLSNLLDKLRWSKNHDYESRQISENARRFVKSNLMPVDIFCYFGKVLQEYGIRMNKSVPIDIPHDYELVSDNHLEKNCHCLSNKNIYYDEL